MKQGTTIAFCFTAAVMAFVLLGCSSTIEEFDEGEKVLTRKFGPSDLENLGNDLMQRLSASRGDWMRGMPRLAIVDFRNTTDMPGMSKTPFFSAIETSLFQMNKFDLIDYENAKYLLKEAGYQRFDAFNNETAVKLGQALRARYVMWGDISVSKDVGAEGRAIKQYNFALKVTDVETHRIVYRDNAKARIKAVK